LSFDGRFGTISLSHFRENPVSLPRPPQAWQFIRKWGLAVSFVGAFAAALSATDAASAKEAHPDAAAGASIAVVQMPGEARLTYRLIHAGGPFPYEKDGTVFGNRERLLPAHQRGYYREYTVRTPWVRHRGARRIVCGGRQPTRPQACYYTADHYASFRRIVD